MRLHHLYVGSLVTVMLWYAPEKTAIAADDVPTQSTSSSVAPQLEEIVVTARKREENLQSVPDAITAFTPDQITNAGILQISDFAALTPNLTLSDASAFRPGGFVLSMRGIGNSQLGWPSVSYIVDGIPADSQDTISIGSLEDIERIEVLRGPQSALYGFNAIAGAINIITKNPTPYWSYDARLIYGNGNDRQADGMVSGPIIPDKLLFRLAVSYLDNDGVIRSTSNDLHLDSQMHKQVQGRLLFTPIENLRIDLHGSYIDERDGAVYQDQVPIEDANTWNAYDARRAFPGTESRDLSRIAARIQWDLPGVSLISETSYSHIDQTTYSSFCYDDPNDPYFPAPGGGDQCPFGLAFGNTAAPGQPIDEYYYAVNNRRSWTEDFRIQSRDGQDLDWTVGVATLNRTALDGFDAGDILAPDRTNEVIFPQWDRETDKWWGVYGQAVWNATSRWQFTAAARYDHDTYQNTGYSDDTLAVVVPVRLPDGTLAGTQTAKGEALQPKGQASFKFTDDLMGYLTVSRGFRAGFYNSGSLTLPEHTTNYEVGFKSTWWDRRATLNVAAFHIDFSNQQSTTYTSDPPYVISSNIPKTDINGVELESNVALSEFVSLSTGFGYLHAQVSDGTVSPLSPRVNANASVDFNHPIASGWSALLHVDGRYTGWQYLQAENQQEIPSTTFINVRAGARKGHYTVTAFVRNATDRRTATFGGAVNQLFPSGELTYIRAQNIPRTFGVELRASF